MAFPFLFNVKKNVRLKLLKFAMTQRYPLKQLEHQWLKTASVLAKLLITSLRFSDWSSVRNKNY